MSQPSVVPGRDRVSLAPMLARALTRLPDCLIDPDARARLLNVANAFPAQLASGPIGLELRLAGAQEIDLFATATPRQPQWEALVAALAQPGPWADPARAAALAAALQEWASARGWLPQVARYLLVEADSAADTATGVPVPSIFLAPREHRDAPVAGQPPNVFHRHIEATVRAGAELSGGWPDPATASALARVVAALPAAGDIFAVGSMLSRPAGSSMRVAIRRLTPSAITAVLGAAGMAELAPAIAECAALAPAGKQAVAFEVGPGAERRVGLELSPAHDWKEATLADWPPLLDYLAGLGVAEPDRLAAAPGLVDPDGDPLWGLAHVKVAAVPGGMLPAAKLYVGLLFPGAR